MLKVQAPDRVVQEKIVSILSAYDDLIENNRRRIALLEEAARMLYREWFIHLRFPGHEHIKIVGGQPVGWERSSLTVLAQDVSYGFTASADQDIEGPKFLRITDIVGGPVRWASVPRCRISEEKQARFLLASDDVVVARTGATTGWARRIGRLAEPAVFASYLVRFGSVNYSAQKWPPYTCSLEHIKHSCRETSEGRHNQTLAQRSWAA